jgi:hypothetical protein
MSNQIIIPGISRELLNDGRIICYTLTSLSVHMLNPWSSAILSSIEAWPKDQPYLVLHDASAKGVSVPLMGLMGGDLLNFNVTPGAQVRIRDLLDAYPQFRIRLAIALSGRFSGQFALTHFRKTAPLNERIETAVFISRSRALEWLEKTPVAYS